MGGAEQHTAADSQTAFYTDLWLNQWRDMEAFNPTARHLQRLIHNELAALDGFDSVLDVGCGMGLNLAAIHRAFPDVALAGTDLSPEILGLAREHLGAGTNPELDVLDLSQRALPRQYDVVLCNQVLEHIDDDRTAMAHLVEMCRGTLIITVPGGKFNSTSRVVGHYRHYRRQDLVRLARDAGVEVQSVREWGFPFHSLYKLVLGALPEDAQKSVGFGKYGLGKRLLTHMIYLLYFANVVDYGANVVLVGKPSR